MDNKEREVEVTKEVIGRGMQLGKPKKNQAAEGLSKGFGFDEDKASFFTPKEEEKQEELGVEEAEQSIDLSISESAQCEVNKFGEVWKFLLRGEVVFTVGEVKKVTKIEFSKPKSEYASKFKIHPEIDKNQWKDTGMLIATDEEMGFAPGSKIDALRYKITADEESQLPFEINIFTTKAAGGKTKISLELEYSDTGKNGKGKASNFSNITVRLNVSDEPQLLKINNSTSNLDQKTGTIAWCTESLNETNSDSLLQFYTTTEEDRLFPLSLAFEYEGSVHSVFDIYE